MPLFGGSINKPGPGVRKDEAEKTGLARYFDILGRRLWKIIALNFIYFVFSIIPILMMWVVCIFSMTWTVSLKMSPTEVTDWANNGGTLMIGVMTLIIYACCGGGPAACGMINVLRKYISDTHAWVWQDFWDSFKENLAPGIIAYVIDCFTVGVLIMNFGFYNAQQGAMSAVLRGLLTLVIVIWGFMHVYIYQIMASFKLRLRDIYKNAFIMTVGKLPQTAAAFVIGFVIAFAIIYFGVAFPYFVLLIPIILFGFLEYSRLSIVYPLMVKYMAEPERPEPDDYGEAVFNDDRTDKQ